MVGLGHVLVQPPQQLVLPAQHIVELALREAPWSRSWSIILSSKLHTPMYASGGGLSGRPDCSPLLLLLRLPLLHLLPTLIATLCTSLS
jgi:hypothetical protein